MLLLKEECETVSEISSAIVLFFCYHKGHAVVLWNQHQSRLLPKPTDSCDAWMSLLNRFLTNLNNGNPFFSRHFTKWFNYHLFWCQCSSKLSVFFSQSVIHFSQQQESKWWMWWPFYAPKMEGVMLVILMMMLNQVLKVSNILTRWETSW